MSAPKEHPSKEQLQRLLNDTVQNSQGFDMELAK